MQRVRRSKLPVCAGGADEIFVCAFSCVCSRWVGLGRYLSVERQATQHVSMLRASWLYCAGAVKSGGGEF